VRPLARLAIVVALGCILGQEDAATDELVTDANIVTALDISDSIDASDVAVEIDGIAAAIQSPGVMQAIQSGHHRRVGFAVFAWSDGPFPELVSWTVIGGTNDAAAVSARLRSDLRAFTATEQAAPSADPHMTDVSGAIDHAAVLLLNAPYATERSVMNVISNGWDNVGEGPRPARNRVLAKGGTINGVLLGYDLVLMDYYRGNVIGGPGAFLLTVENPAAMTAVLARKFHYDIAMKHEDGEDQGAAGVTRQTTLPTSSATSSAPLRSMATPTGRPNASPSLLRKPVRMSTGMPAGRPSLNGTKITL
jgi:uncharacterized protein DUF1194